jgi:type II secretory pathway pseudopilin PulG
MRSLKNKSNGFTLIEVAVVFVILAFLLGSLISPMSAQRETTNIKKAEEELKNIEDALLGFAISNGYLPCPTFPGLGGVAIGLGGTANCLTGGNPTYNGFIPSTTLGLRGEVNCDDLLVDPWGQPYRYSITQTDNTPNGLHDFVRTNDLQTETIVAIQGAAGTPPNLRVCNNRLAVCNAATVAGNIVANNVVAVYFSLGKHVVNPSAGETENSAETTVNSGCLLPAYGLSNDRFFYSYPRVELAGNEFDDIVMWLSPTILYSKMLAAGQLP